MDQLVVQSLGRTCAELREFISSRLVLPAPESGLALFVQSHDSPDRASSEFLRDWPDGHSIRHPQNLACFGYMLGIERQYEQALQTSWITNCETLLRRDPFPLDRQSFAFRPVEVLGLALGIAACSLNGSECEASFKRFLENCSAQGNSDPWSQIFYWFASQTIGFEGYPAPKLPLETYTLDVASLIKCLSIRKDISSVASDSVVRSAEAVVLKCCSTGEFTNESVAHASVLLSALSASIKCRIESRLRETLTVSANSEDAINLVVKLCRRFPLFARQLQERRRDVKGEKPTERLLRPTIQMADEYDVQDALHAILRLFFDDVRPEIWTPDYAANQKRVDFLLPEIEMAIEVKHTRERLTQQEIADQLIIDERYYRRHGSCRRLICFVYDPQYRCKNPVALETDLTSHEENFQVLVIVGPQGV